MTTAQFLAEEESVIVEYILVEFPKTNWADLTLNGCWHVSFACSGVRESTREYCRGTESRWQLPKAIHYINSNFCCFLFRNWLGKYLRFVSHFKCSESLCGAFVISEFLIVSCLVVFENNTGYSFLVDQMFDDLTIFLVLAVWVAGELVCTWSYNALPFTQMLIKCYLEDLVGFLGPSDCDSRISVWAFEHWDTERVRE